MQDEEPPLVRWAAVTGADLALIADGGWRHWPAAVPFQPSDARPPVEALARTMAHDRGVGHVVRIALDRRQVSASGAADLVAIEPGMLEHVLACALMEDAEYRSAVDDVEIARAEAAMKRRFPPHWRRHLQAPVRFHRGWMATGAYVWLNTPDVCAQIVGIWEDLGLGQGWAGMIPIGNDGSREMLTLDARDPYSRVTLTAIVSDGWNDSIVQCDSIDALIATLEDGTFEYVG